MVEGTDGPCCHDFATGASLASTWFFICGSQDSGHVQKFTAGFAWLHFIFPPYLQHELLRKCLEWWRQFESGASWGQVVETYQYGVWWRFRITQVFGLSQTSLMWLDSDWLHCHLEDPVLAVKQSHRWRNRDVLRPANLHGELRLGQRAGARAEISQKEVKDTPGLRFKRADRLDCWWLL